MNYCMSTVASIVCMLFMSTLVNCLPVYTTEFVVSTTETSEETIANNVIAFVNDLSLVLYDFQNVTVKQL